MRLFYRPAFRKRAATFLLLLTVSEIGLPGVSYALTSGPSQPEFSSFEPVSTNQLVDEFSGDFTYNIPVINIPGPQGSDYPLSLSYHSGATPEEEASWVGYGWTLNPGAINRNTRGFPDDFKNASVKYWNKMPANWTVTAGAGVGVEVFSKDIASANFAIRYNNYQGYGYNAGVGLSLGKGIVSLGYHLTDGQTSFSASISPANILTRAHETFRTADASTRHTHRNKPGEAHKLKDRNVSLLGGNHGLFTYSEANRPAHAGSYYGGAFNVSAGLQGNWSFLPAGVTANIFGSLNWQKNFDSENLNAYGYMYSHEADATATADNTIEDYFTEKETPYNKRDNFLGIPFNNSDVFSVSGEGVGGGFRLYHDKVGEFIPNKKTSGIGILNISLEISAGWAFGWGNDFGAGYQEFSEGPWESTREKFSPANAGDDKVFFRFANDLGGESSSLISDEPVFASLNHNNINSPNKSALHTQLGQTAAHGRASFIAYHTIEDIYSTNTQKTRLSRGFSHRQDFSTSYGLPVNYNELAPGSISELAIATANGGRYIYGLPVLSKEEGNLQYGIKGETLHNNYTVSTNKSDNQMDVMVGEQRGTAYGSSFPLTEIQTPDYVDRTLDGPTADDFGGYTRFNYVKLYGGSNRQDWYNWRTPYSGLLYQPNSLSDKADDMGTVSYGKKEIVYMQSVQTKTHTAIFVLGPRDDSRDAGDEYTSPLPRNRDATANPVDKKALKKLVRIDLYANGDVEQTVDSLTQQVVVTAKSTAKPIKSVHFSYSNGLFSTTGNEGLPNALINGGNRVGKLTLTRIWFEYQGVPTKVSPYTFSYNYPDRYNDYPTQYQPDSTQSVTTISDGSTTGGTTSYYENLPTAVQNPGYTPFCLDAWGNFRNDGETRAKNLLPWLDQRDLDDPDVNKSGWDPAAWQLKSITLPTGGQIQVQYEQDDYAFVQDKPVHAMARLLPVGGNDKFYLDLGSLGLNTDAERKATVAALKSQYTSDSIPAFKGSKIFFKFLYNLADAVNPTLLPLTANSEYISGYTTVKNVGLDPTGVYIELGGPGYLLPRDVCMNFLQTQRAGKLSSNDFDATLGAPESAVRDLLMWYKTLASPANECAVMNPALSYFRIPLIKPKKGGGLRVKRLLTFDKTGLDDQAVLYGSEYSYRTLDAKGRVISSGVATTEPSSMREENILVNYLPRQDQGLFSRIIAGLDRKQTEGPLGESLLPAPSVGYSRVVVRNIHSGRTSPGFSISEFATARDYPMQVKYSTMQTDTKFQLIYALFITNQVDNSFATQGYSFLLNNMHGQPTRRATYSGDYPGLGAALPSPTNEQKYTYYEPARVTDQNPVTPGNAIPVVAEQGSKPTTIYPGREVDITSAQKAVKDNMLDLNFEMDVDVAIFFFPITYFAVFPSLTHTQAEMYTHVTSKVIRYPAVIKRIETTQDGIKHVTENIAFDRLSGQAVQTKETDEFKGGYAQETVQAAWIRPEFGPKWERENQFITTATPSSIVITPGSNNELWLSFSGSACDGLAKITRGDHLGIVLPNNDGDNAVYFADAPDFVNNRVRIYPVVLPFNPTALPAGISTSTPTTVTSVRILTSGRQNLLTAAAGSTTYHRTNYSTVEPFTSLSKYATSAFTSAVNSWLNTSTKPNDSFQSSATFSHMNMSAYAGKLPPGCVKDPSDVSISNVVLAKRLINGQTTISLVSFRVVCDGGNGGAATALVQN